MIKVNRPKSPEILTKKYRKWTQELLETQDSEKKKRIEKRYNKPHIRKVLREMFHNKCAFCERKLTGGDRIEHFRPRKLFPELTFEWTNLLLSCETCNLNKSDRFPVTSNGESAIDPSLEDPSPHLLYDYNEKLKWVSIYGKNVRGKISIELVDLNRPRLREERFVFILRLKFVALYTQQDLQAASILHDALLDSSEFAGSVRALIDLC